MKSRHYVLVLGLALSPGSTFAQQGSDFTLDAAGRKAVIDGLLERIEKTYVLPDVAQKMEEAIRARQARKEYDAITSGPEFAQALTRHLREVCHDRHLAVEFFPGGVQYDAAKEPSAEDIEQFRRSGARRNYEFRKVERLDGGVGLLQVDGFFPARWTGETMAAAMTFLASGDAVILDLRYNGGGDPSGVLLLCSYFFDEPAQLSDRYNRSEGTIHQSWTQAFVTGQRMVDKDLYILTSSRTFSAPEALAYDMQVLKRATIVGEQTGGGAHGTTSFGITDHFSARIPFSRAINPVTKSDWEGTGVKPDVAVRADRALLVAHLMALRKALSKATDKGVSNELEETIAAKEGELKALEAEGKP